MENKKLELINKIIKTNDKVSKSLDIDHLYNQYDLDAIANCAKELKQILLEEDTYKNASENMEV